MNYSIVFVDHEGVSIYVAKDGTRSCAGHDPVFQQWLRDNQDNLPADIQAKVDAGELTIQDADTPSTTSTEGDT